MRVHLSALTFDLDGAITLDCLPVTTSGEVRRRMNRVATLDGGAAFNDFGYSEADRTFDLRWGTTAPDNEALIARLVRLYSRLRLTTKEGAWIVAPEAYTPGVQESRLRLLCVEKLTED